ncbi:lipocalin family protein [Christiangramia sp. OXR-203]|uniref:lipocalin family protein n=1 Tax=Christiangramia sp. OXR-203 TaxID=3100176 RepID=UPI002AC95A90|nr:lipocalin family protein [Christiangramia sp. OXR-203]WPY97136.1 lipocalin family protein [Christiangramia sp. OXR-203]
MKKIFILLATIGLLASCGGTSKVAKEARKSFDGQWILTSVTYPNNPGQFNVTLFNEAQASCFENSNWDFVSNNNRGTYTVSGTGCDGETNQFIWSIDEENTPQGIYDFLLKPTNEDYKSTTGNEGFRLNLQSLTDTNMTWSQTVSLDGSPFTIKMNFTKL